MTQPVPVPASRSAVNEQPFSITALFASAFTLVFFAMSAIVLCSSVYRAIVFFIQTQDFTQFTIQIVNGGIIAMALFELATVIAAEYGRERSHDVITMMKRTLPRFIGTVAIALALEGLMMVIKYSQLDLAGNLYYPVAIIVSAAILLIALGVFIRFAESSDSTVAES
ncbi:hypothetical protein [Reinekea blandensis]|nr:hypothetical protein [Reinekea blandensis]